ncbi:MAG TPA: biopolymer transporter ExbD [Pirellulaceae bacterium]|nr:biopolymer transporter ExbD [Pirellulaceae bacterium]HMO91671.1 biopolymer transporter ExbD [Pirellulaceae bacterium]HMP68368.1 biopolymer transporter ExbD [Pirellulaceae bacterium]
MRLAKRKHSRSIRLSLTPMIDIVFLLIIFFMTLPQLTTALEHPLELPIVQQIKSSRPEEQMTINVDQLGHFYIGDRKFSLALITDTIADRSRQLNLDISEIRILVRADGRVPTSVVNELIDSLNRQGVKQVQISSRSQR